VARPDGTRLAGHERPLVAGREALRAAGVGDAESTPAALLPLVGRAPELDLAIAERFGREATDDRAAALRELATGAERRGWKVAAKEARRALYHFAQRGVAIPPAPVPEPAVRRRPASPLEGYLSPVDGRGDRLVWLVRVQHRGGLVVLTGVLNEPAGLREIAVAELPRKTLRRMARDLETRHRLRMVPADGDYCDALLAEGFARARAAGMPGVGEYPTYRARLLSADPAPREPALIARVVDLDSAPIADTAARGAELFDQPEFATWPLERPLLAPYLAEIAAVRESPLVLSQPQQEERVRSIVARALHEIFGGARGAAYRRRLEEMAYYLHATGRRVRARTAAATARALASSARGGEGIPLVEELTRRSFAALLAEDSARAQVDAENSLLVRPGAARAPATPRRFP
jgi:hypothetical protein